MMFGPHWREELQIRIGTWVLKYIVKPIAEFGKTITQRIFFMAETDNEKKKRIEEEKRKIADTIEWAFILRARQLVRETPITYLKLIDAIELHGAMSHMAQYPENVREILDKHYGEAWSQQIDRIIQEFNSNEVK